MESLSSLSPSAVVIYKHQQSHSLISKQELGMGVGQSGTFPVLIIYNSSIMDLPQPLLSSVKKQRLGLPHMLACRGGFSCMKHTAVCLCVVCNCGSQWLKFLLSAQNHLQNRAGG